MSDRPKNIATSRAQCLRDCSKIYWRKIECPEVGDVRRCVHGRLWLHDAYSEHRSRFEGGVYLWRLLAWYESPVLWFRARKALKDDE